MPNKKDLKALTANLKTKTVARAKFLAGILALLENSGVDVTDEKVIKDLDLDLNLADGEKFVKGLAASTVVITLVM